MTKIILTTLILIPLLTSCSSYQARKQVVDDQVWQCQELCAGGNVAVARINGLKCLCNTKVPTIQAIIPQAQPTVHYTMPERNVETVYITEERKTTDKPKKRLTKIKSNATIINNGARHIISQTK